MNYETIGVQRDGSVATITLNRPDAFNALNLGLGRDLFNASIELDEDPEVRCVVVTGSGKSFCAGGDVAAWSVLGAEQFARHWIRDGHAGFDALARLSQPVIAVLNGHCLGGGLELAACADYRIAERHARIGLPETSLGIIPGWSGTQRTARRFGPQLIRRMSLFGEVYSAEEALRLSLVDKVVDKGSGLASAEELAAVVAGRSATATELAKMLINAAEGEERERVLDAFAGRIAAGSDDLRAGLAAFRKKGLR